MSFCPARMMMSAAREVDFTGSTELKVTTVSANQSFSLYKAVAVQDAGKVAVDWGDGSIGSLAPDPETGEVTLSHVYASPGVWTVRIQDRVAEIHYSHAKPVSADTYTETGEFFTGASCLTAVTSLGSSVANRTLSYGMFANTGISEPPSMYRPPLITPVNATARMIPFGCFYQCSNLTGLGSMNTADVRAVDAFAFTGCASLDNVDAMSSASVISIGYRAFKGCTSLRNVDGLANGTIAAQNADGLFAGALYYSIDGYDNSKRTYTRHTEVIAALDPDGDLSRDSWYKYAYWRAQHFMLAIGKEAFNGCTSLTSVAGLHMTSGYLLPGTFSGCSSLVTIPTYLVEHQGGGDYQNTFTQGNACWAYVEGAWTYYPETYSHPSIRWKQSTYFPGTSWDWTDGGTFDGCPASNVFYGSRRVYPGGQYRNCTGLTEVTFTASYFYGYSLGSGVFAGCVNLKKVNFPNATMAQVQNFGNTAMNGYGYLYHNYPWGLPSGCRIVCSDGTLTVA